jgi:hypothetical protein
MMAKKKSPSKKAAGKIAKEASEAQVQPEPIDPFIGGEEDDLSDMEYMQDEHTSAVDTHPPETAEEAEQRAEQKEPEEEETEDVETEEQTETEAEAEEPESTEEAVPDAEEGEAVDDEVSAESDDEAGTEGRVPKSRFDEVNERMKKAEAKVEGLEKQLETVIEGKTEEIVPEYDYEGKEKEAMDAILEGDTKKYAEIRAEIRAAERQDTLREAEKLAEKGDRTLKETLTFEEAGAKIEEQYPELSQKSEIFNEAAREELLDLYVGYAKSGSYTSVQALQKAAKVVAKVYDLGAKDEVVEDKEPDNVVTLKQPDVKKKIKVAEDQPPELESRAPGTSGAEPTIDVVNMPDDEFEALPESTKRRLRGDVL